MVENDYKPLKPFRGWVLENFPFIENDFDALTNYQLFCKIIEYINNIIKDVTAIEDSIDDVIKLVNDIKAYVDEYLEDITDIKEEIEDINNSISGLETDISVINNEIVSLRNYTTDLVNGTFNTLKDYVDTNDTILDEKIENLKIGEIQVYDPTTGEEFEYDYGFFGIQAVAQVENNTMVTSWGGCNNGSPVQIALDLSLVGGGPNYPFAKGTITINLVYIPN